MNNLKLNENCAEFGIILSSVFNNLNISNEAELGYVLKLFVESRIIEEDSHIYNQIIADYKETEDNNITERDLVLNSGMIHIQSPSPA